MNGPWLKSQHFLLSSGELRAGKLPAILSAQEKNAIQFINQWVNGQQEFLFQTSGSTGEPKKISFNRDQLTASASLTEEALHLTPGSTALICFDVNFIAGAMMLVRCLTTGMNMVLAEPGSNPLATTNDRIDFAAFVPLQVKTMLDLEWDKLNQIKTIIIGGASANESLIEKLQGLSTSVYGTYGMTETISHIALQKLNGPDRQDFFRALPGIRLSTDDRRCLIIVGSHLGPSPVVTNDLVTLLDEKNFRWTGRFDRIINTGGIKVQAENIERITSVIFMELKISNRFFIAGVPDPHLGEKVILLVEGNLSQEDESKLIYRLKLGLSKYENPKATIKVNRFAETPTQKIDRLQTLKSLL